jgi:hypothetical protein
MVSLSGGKKIAKKEMPSAISSGGHSAPMKKQDYETILISDNHKLLQAT